jgi:2-polyprenyl-6-methoxyphenol hydroxylase-like FAD-dependent oxidoreductase
MTPAFTILGGGIAGLTTALALKQIGIASTVIEAAPEFRPVGAGIVLAVNAMRAYRRLGLYDQLLAAGNAVEKISIYDDQGTIINRTFTPGVEGLTNLAIHRAELHRVLLGALGDMTIITGKRSRDLEVTDKGYRVLFEDGFTVDTPYLIVAEGINSPIRRSIVPQSRLRYSGYTCWRGIADNTLHHIHESSETWGPKGRFGMVPIGEGKVYWFACRNAPPADSRMKAAGTADLLQLFKDYHPPIADIIRTTPDSQMIWSDISDLEPMDRYAYGNLVFIGDAAHATTPNMGQGACQAIEDAMVLANCLQKTPPVQEAFRAFEQKRVKRTHFIVNQSWQLGRVAQWENPVLTRLRNFAIRSIPQRVFQRQVEKVYETDF